jgi:hypothetical protein
MRLNDLFTSNLYEEVSQQELLNVEKFADALWSKLGIEVEFTRHFFDRVNDPRNVKQISAAELVRLFKKEYERYGKQIAQLGDHSQAVLKDLFTNLNLPVVMQDRGDHKDMIAKTVMRKPDFKTTSPEYSVRENG